MRLTRGAAIGIGTIAMLAGVLILCGIPGLSTLGTTAGGIFCAVGFTVLLAGACLRCVKESVQLESESSAYLPDEEDSTLKSNGTQQSTNPQNGSAVSSDKSQNKDNFIGFSKITPENYEQYLDVSKRETRKKGDFVFTKRIHNDDLDMPPYKYKKGDIYLDGKIRNQDNGWYGGGGLEICNGEFVHYPQMAAPPVHFSNLKDFFDYLFRGQFYQGECTRDMEFFTLRTIDGKEVRYNNPYKK